jgi:hypothetical protein
LTRTIKGTEKKIRNNKLKIRNKELEFKLNGMLSLIEFLDREIQKLPSPFGKGWGVF